MVDWVSCVLCLVIRLLFITGRVPEASKLYSDSSRRRNGGRIRPRKVLLIDTHGTGGILCNTPFSKNSTCLVVLVCQWLDDEA